MQLARRPRTPLIGAALAALVFAGCGDDEHVDDTDAAPAVDAPPAIDAAIDAPPFVFTPPTPKAVPLSAMGSDYLLTATAAPGGAIYAAGPVGATIGGTRVLTVVKIKADGTLDTTWGGGDGIVPTTLTFVGANQDIKIYTRPDGKILVITQVPNATNAMDRDVAIIRLNADGTVDNSFGGAGNGIKILDVATAIDVNGTLMGADTPRGIAIDRTNGAIYAFVAARAAGNTPGGTPRTDTDWTITKMSADGVVDATFGGSGRFSFNLAGEMISEQPRWIQLLPDGNLMLNGYGDSAALGAAHALVVKVSPTGALVPAFATGGVFHQAVMPVQFEVYQIEPDGNTGFGVSQGYGRASGTNNDFVSMRINLTTGALDTTFGANGGLAIDPSGMDKSDNGRVMTRLPNGSFALGGSCGPGNMAIQDACWAIIKPSGQLDTTFGTGRGELKLNAAADGNDAFWGATVSGNKLFMVGYRGGGALASQTATNNDDSYVVVFDLPPAS